MIFSYLSNRQKYVQLDDKKSSYRPIYFGVPQGSILGLVLFNIYVSSLPSCLKSNSIQYADDTCLYLTDSIRNIQYTISILETDIRNLNTWSESNGLVFNNDKLLSVLFTSKRKVYDRSYLMESSGKSIKQKPTAKLLGITFDCNLTWNEQINIIMKSTYGVLRVLKTFRRFTTFTTCKYLAESLVLSRINYCNVVYDQMPKYLVKRLQRVQNCAAGYVLSRYANAVDVVNLNWLPILEGIEYNISKLTYQGLNDKNWQSYLPVEVVTQKRTLRSNNLGPCVDLDEKHTFQDQAKNTSNKLPFSIRSHESKIIFNRQAREFYKDKALARDLLL